MIKKVLMLALLLCSCNNDSFNVLLSDLYPSISWHEKKIASSNITIALPSASRLSYSMQNSGFSVSYYPEGTSYREVRNEGNYLNSFYFSFNLTPYESQGSAIDALCAHWVQTNKKIVRESDAITEEFMGKSNRLFKILPKCSEGYFYVLVMNNKYYGISSHQYQGPEGSKLMEDILLNIRVSDETST